MSGGVPMSRHVRAARRTRLARAGYTLIEIMMALAVLAGGAAAIMGLQQAAIRGNQEANEMATATRIAEMWLDRYRLDGLRWTTGGPTATPGPTQFTNTAFMQAMPASGSTGWHVPPSSTTFLAATSLQQTGNPTGATGAPSPYFCVQSNLTWVYLGTAIRADVRVFWRRRSWASGEAGALTCPANPDRRNFHMVQSSSVIRWRTPQ